MLAQINIGDRVSWKLRGQVATWEKKSGQRVEGTVTALEERADGLWLWILPDHRASDTVRFRNNAENEPMARLKKI